MWSCPVTERGRAADKYQPGHIPKREGQAFPTPLILFLLLQVILEDTIPSQSKGGILKAIKRRATEIKNQLSCKKRGKKLRPGCRSVNLKIHGPHANGTKAGLFSQRAPARLAKQTPTAMSWCAASPAPVLEFLFLASN